MKRIGLMSDTHGFIDPKIYDYFKNVDEIWHAGDVGDVSVIDELRKFKPLVGVYGILMLQMSEWNFQSLIVFGVKKLKY